MMKEDEIISIIKDCFKNCSIKEEYVLYCDYQVDLLIDNNLAIECKGKIDGMNHRLGLGQALTYAASGYTSALAVYKMDPIIKEVIYLSPIYGIDIHSRKEVYMIDTKDREFKRSNFILEHQQSQLYTKEVYENLNEINKILEERIESLEEENKLLKYDLDGLSTELEELQREYTKLKSRIEMLPFDLPEISL